MKNINPSRPEGANSQEKLVKMVDSAVNSSDKVMLENQISGMSYNLKGVSGEDWAKFRALAGGLDMTDEETQAVETTISMVQSMRPEFSEERRSSSLQSFARTSKIIDVATANKVFDRLPRINEDKIQSIRSATTGLMEALSFISNKYDVQEAVERRGLIISKDEVQEATERGKGLNIV